MRIRGVRKKLYRFTYDKPGVNKKALQIQRSLDEVKQQLGKKGRKGKKEPD